MRLKLNFSYSTEHELEDQVNEWANMTGFLCALGGVCLQRKSPLRGGQDQAKKAAAAAAATGMLPHGAGQDIQYCPVTQFLGQLLRLLVCPNEKFGNQIQKNVKELVAYEMSPALYPILFDQIKIIVEKFFDSQSQVIVNDTNTQFIEHIIFIMKNVLDAKPEGHPPENLGHSSIEQMMLAIGNVQLFQFIILEIQFGPRKCTKYLNLRAKNARFSSLIFVIFCQIFCNFQ